MWREVFDLYNETHSIEIIYKSDSNMFLLDKEVCENCGTLEVELDWAGFCERCTCDRCGKHGTMDIFGTCGECNLEN